MLNTYAPHTQYNQDELDKYRDDIGSTIKHIPNNVINLLRTGNNGQVSKTKFSHNCIGDWAISNKTDKGNGENIVQTCMDNDIICSNAHFAPNSSNKNNLSTLSIYDCVI